MLADQYEKISHTPEIPVAASEFFFLELYNLIKKEIYILITIPIKKIHKYIKFIITFYKFLYFEIGA